MAGFPSQTASKKHGHRITAGPSVQNRSGAVQDGTEFCRLTRLQARPRGERQSWEYTPTQRSRIEHLLHCRREPAAMEGKGKITQYTAEAADLYMKVAVESADGLDSWQEGSVTAFLMGEDSAPARRVWKPEELALFDQHKLPSWVVR